MSVCAYCKNCPLLNRFCIKEIEEILHSNFIHLMQFIIILFTHLGQTLISSSLNKFVLIIYV